MNKDKYHLEFLFGNKSIIPEQKNTNVTTIIPSGALQRAKMAYGVHKSENPTAVIIYRPYLATGFLTKTEMELFDSLNTPMIIVKDETLRTTTFLRDEIMNKA